MFSQEDFQKIEATVKSIETKTRGEIVPVIIRSSRSYPEGWFALAIVGALVFGVLSWQWGGWLNQGWVISVEAILLEICLGATVGLALGLIPAIRRFFIRKHALRESVHQRALAEFTRQGVMNTQDRCGILLLVSVFEHRAELVADRGIHSQVPDGYWDQELALLSRNIKKCGLTEAITDGITRLGALLAEKFPRQEGTTNELGDQPRIEK